MGHRPFCISTHPPGNQFPHDDEIPLGEERSCERARPIGLEMRPRPSVRGAEHTNGLKASSAGGGSSITVAYLL
jgi:hypothetical protein